MDKEENKSKEQLEIDAVRKGKKAEDCSIYVEDMIIAGELEGDTDLARELAREHKKRSSKKKRK